jgi:hypothetical protein
LQDTCSAKAGALIFGDRRACAVQAAARRCPEIEETDSLAADGNGDVGPGTREALGVLGEHCVGRFDGARFVPAFRQTLLHGD